MAPENVALVGVNGHVATETIRNSDPDELGGHCAACGAPTIQSCPACSAPSPGSDPRFLGAWAAPAFCIRCGAPYPWTEVRLAAARERH